MSMSIGKTPIEKYLLDEATLEETKQALGKSMAKPFTEKQLNPKHESGEEMFPPQDKKQEVVGFYVSKKMKMLLEVCAKAQGRNMSNLMNCIVKDYFSRLND